MSRHAKIVLTIEEPQARALAAILNSGHGAWEPIAEALVTVADGKYDSAGVYEDDGFEVSTP